MSVEANTFEKMSICNINKKTALVAEDVAKYLTQISGIRDFSLDVDGKTYTSNDDSLPEEILEVCRKLHAAKSIVFSLRSCTYIGISWKEEHGFLKHLTDDPELLDTIEYRCTEYYDQDSGVVIFRYGKKGGSDLEYTTDSSVVRDIATWFCYTPELSLQADDYEDETLHCQLLECLKEIAVLANCGDEIEEDMDDVITDDWGDFGEMVFLHSLTFSTENIPKMLDKLQKLADIAAENNVRVSLEIAAVPDGENDYDFATVSITLKSGKVVAEYCIF